MIAIVQQELQKVAGHNPEHYAKINPTGSKPLGVRMADLRKLAKRIAKGEFGKACDFLANYPLCYYEDELLHALVIGYLKDDVHTTWQYFLDFLPKVHCWSVCDTLSQNYKTARKDRAYIYAQLQKLAKSKSEYKLRAVAVVLLSHFLDSDYLPQAVAMLTSLPHYNYYYVKMAIAWGLAEAISRDNTILDRLNIADKEIRDMLYSKIIASCKLQHLRDKVREMRANELYQRH